MLDQIRATDDHPADREVGRFALQAEACGFGAADDDLRSMRCSLPVSRIPIRLGERDRRREIPAGLQRIEYGLRHCWHICRTHEGIVEVMEIEGRPNQIERRALELVDRPVSTLTLAYLESCSRHGFRRSLPERSSSAALRAGRRNVAFFATHGSDPREVSTADMKSATRSQVSPRELDYFDGLRPASQDTCSAGRSGSATAAAIYQTGRAAACAWCIPNTMSIDRNAPI